MTKEIGGYFSLELRHCDQKIPASKGVFLNTGRNSLEYILRSIKAISKIFIPYYTCNTILEPLEKLRINYEFYHINLNLEITSEINLGKNEYLIYTNYFGIKDNYVKSLSEKYGSKLIVDNAQALFADPTQKCAYSPRKFLGIPDGGIAFTDETIDIQLERSMSYDICSHLLKRVDCGGSSAYSNFRENSKVLSQQPIKYMSILTESILDSVDFEEIVKKRKDNFEYLHSHLKDTNKLLIPLQSTFSCPMVYPYYVDDDNLRKQLIDKKIYVATYWPNIFDWCKQGTTEYNLAKYLIPLPIDQRYGIEDMIIISEMVKKLI